MSTKDFFKNLLDLLKTGDAAVQDKILKLIGKWNAVFEPKKDVIPNFCEIYRALSNRGLVFPPYYESDYLKYFPSFVAASLPVQKIDLSKSLLFTDDLNACFFRGCPVDLIPGHYESKYKRLCEDTKVALENIDMFNELIDNGTLDEDIIGGVFTSLKEIEKNLNKCVFNQCDTRNGHK